MSHYDILMQKDRDIERLKARNFVLEAAIEYDKAPSDAEFEPPHPIFQLAKERDDFMLKCGAQIKEIEQLRARVVELEGNAIFNNSDTKLMIKFLEKLRDQRPEKPDHWSSCSQCEHNSNEAGDLLEAIIAKAAPQQEQE